MGQIWDFLIVRPIAALLSFFYNLTNNYGLAILLFAIAAKVVLLYFAYKSKRGMLQQQRLQPKVAELQKKFSKDKQKLQQAQAKLYQDEGVSMFGGCLWMLLPFPIIIALFGAVRQPMTYIMGLNQQEVADIQETLLSPVTSAYNILEIAEANRKSAQANLNIAQDELDAEETYAGRTELQKNVNEAQLALTAAESKYDTAKTAYQAQELAYENELNAQKNGTLELHIANRLTTDPDFYIRAQRTGIEGLKQINFRFLGLNLAGIPSFSSILVIIPLLSAVTSFLSVWLTQKFSGRAAQGRGSMVMMYALGPGISLWLGFSWPAAIGLYWIAQNLLGVPQEYYLTKHFNKVLDEEEARKTALEERRKAAEAAQKEEDRQRRAERIAEQNKKYKPKRYKLQNKPVSPEDPEEQEEE